MKTHSASVEPLEARIAPATFHWDIAGSGNWNDQNNWFNETTGLPDNGFPNAADDVAKFTTANTAGAIVTINGGAVSAGALVFDDDNSYIIAASGGGSLILSSAGTASISISRSNGDAAHTILAPITLASPLLLTHNANFTFSLSGAISESSAGMSFKKDGPGSAMFSGGVANTFTGTTTVEEGTLTFQKLAGFSSIGGALVVGGTTASAAVLVTGTSQIPDTSAVTINAFSSVTLNISEQIGALSINGGTFNLGVNSNTVLVASSLTMTGGKVQMDFPSQSLSLLGNVIATSDSDGPALITGGQLGLSGARIFTIDDGPQAQDLTISSLMFNGSVTKNGAGTMRFAGTSANLYSGTTTVNAGTLELAKVGVNAIGGALTIGDGTGGAEADAVKLINGDQIANNVTVTVNSSGLLDADGQPETLGSVTITGGHATTGASATTLTINTGLTLNAGRLSAAAAGSVITVPATVTANTAGQSIIDGAGALAMPASGLTLAVNNGAADVDLLVTTPITGANGLLKSGAGTLQLDGTSTYTGDTTAFGRLIVNGKIGTVLLGSSSSTLAGSGTVGNIVLNGGSLRPGTSPGVLKTGNIASGSGDTFYFEIDGATPGNGTGFHDQLAVTGSVNLTNVNANFTVTATFTPGDQYTLIANDGIDAVTGNFTNLPEGSITTVSGRRYIITYKGGDGNDVVLTPEQAFIIEGDLVPGADDAFVIQRDATDPKLLHITDYSAYVSQTRTWDVSLNQFANIEIHGGAGDDSVYFDAKNGFFTSSFGNVIYALTFIGGDGVNSITLADLSATVQSFGSYSSFAGPDAGSASYASGFRARFEEVAFFSDEISVSDYQVYGQTGGADVFSFGPSYGASNHIGIDGRLGLDTRYKTKISFFGNGGDDSFNIGPAGIDAPSTIAIHGADNQSSALNIAGTSGADSFTLTTTSATDGSISRTGQPMISYTGALRLAFEGGAGADMFALPSADFDVRITGGPDVDTLTFASGVAGVALNLDTPGTTQALNASGAQLTLSDRFESVIGTDLADIFYAKPAPLARTLNGGAGSDVLVFDAGGAGAVKSADMISAPGFGALATTNVENSTLLNVPAKTPFGAQGNTFATPLDFAAGKGALAVAVGDLNGDGRADFVTADSKAGTVSIALSTATGLLLPAVQKLTGGTKPVSIALGDFDGVNGPDIAVTNATTGTVGILLNDGTGNFGGATTLAVGKTPGVLRASDLDGDGDIDLAAIVGGSKVALVKNTGGATFAAPTTFPSGALKAKDLALADLDGDSDLDLAVLHTGGQLTTHVNDGTATFATPTTTKVGAGAIALALADFNGDGKLDAAVTHNSVSRFVAVLLGKGDASFLPMLRVTYPLAAKASAIVASDFDGDGLADLAIANSVGGRVNVLRSLGSSGFARALELSLDDMPARKLSALALGDFDGDGRVDLAALSSATSEVSVVLRA